MGTLVGLTRDRELAEDCAQDAFAVALRRWRREGVPRRPGAWLTAVARNRAIDRLRHETVRAARLPELVAALPADDGQPRLPQLIRDAQLRLVFTCCHPVLPLASQVALTLRAVAGLSTAETARALLVPVATVAQRLVRAKRTIREARVRCDLPAPPELPGRATAVLAVLYLLFNEGYAATAGADLVRRGLCAEALRLVRLLARLMPGDPEVLGLLALMLLHEARREARVDDRGDLVTLQRQDRDRWDRGRIDEALDHLDRALRLGRSGPYQIQAAIVACHVTAPDVGRTDWAQIAGLYAELLAWTPSPVVALNRAVAVGMAAGPAPALALVEQLERSGDLDGYHLLPAVRADLLRRLGRTSEAAHAYRAALRLATNDPERRFLAARLAELTDGGPEPPDSAGMSIPA